MGTINRNIARFDFTAVYTHRDARVDIILVHGLNGAPQKTWTASNKVYWPADLLPNTLAESGVHVNVFVWGYNADVFSGKHRHPSQNYLHQHAQNMVTYLASLRRDNGRMRVPIIWVAHSFGGLVLKSALSHADRCRETGLEHLRAMFVSTFGIIFLGTPHEGSDLAKWGELVQGMVEWTVSKRIFESHSILLKTLSRNSEALENANFEFIHIMQKFEVCLVYEEATTNIGGFTRRVVVDQKSAAPTFWNGKAQKFGIEANHSDMCKFSGNDAPGYRSISSCISDWSKKSPDFISARWENEDANCRLQAQATLREMAVSLVSQEMAAAHSATAAPPSPIPTLLMPVTNHPSLPSLPSGLQSLKEPPFFYHPEVFRPNSYFVGRVEQLEELHIMLQDPEQRKDGTSAVLVRARTGGGKTHMVRKYVFEHRNDYSGGVFWIQAHSIEDLELELQRLWQLIRQDQNYVESRGDVLSTVRSWFNSRQNWLIVLDGIMSGEGMERFVPDAINTSLIYTSTSPAFTGNYLYANPRLLEIPPFSVEDAQHLLLEEMEHKKPWTTEVLLHAAEVVRLVEKLPLMIHVLAQQLKETREPLSAFLKRYKKKPTIHRKIRPFDFVLGRLDERGASAALNVLYVLAFFDQYLPVEMLALGLRALTLPWRTGEAGSHAKATLNNTLRVLIAFALVERSDSHEISPTSSRTSKKSLEMSMPLMDTLKVYPIVQRYVIEYMEGESEEVQKEGEGSQREMVHLYWLQRAIDVFCKSLQGADAKIMDSPKIGLPVDYHRYRVHGRKLLSHIQRYESSHVELTPWRQIMEDKLKYIDERFQKLEVQMNYEPSDEQPRFSVFDRVNSLSESDSGTLSSQTNSHEAVTPPTGEQPPHHFPPPGLPYPVTDDEVMDENIGAVPKQRYRGWDKHKRAWSQSSTIRSLWSPAELSISHEHASVSSFQVTKREASRRVVSESSDAETSLINVRQKSSRSPTRGAGVVQGKERSASSGSWGNAADLVRTGEGHYASPTLSELTPFDERHTAEFSLGPPAPSRRSSFMDRVKENLPQSWLQRRKSLASSSAKPTLMAPTSARSSPGFRQTAVMPVIPGLSDRSVRSSPGEVFAPFLPPQKTSTSALCYPPPPALYQQYTEPYQPSLPRVDSSSLDPMAMSFPSPQQTPRRGGAHVPPGGIASTPMSRGSSRQSSNTSRGRPSGDYSRGTSDPRGSIDVFYRATSPFSSQLESGVFASRSGDLTLDGQGRRLRANTMETSSSVELRQVMGPPDLSLRPHYGSLPSAIAERAGDTLGMPGPHTYARMGFDASNAVVGPGSSIPLRSRRGSSASNLGQQAAIMATMPQRPVSPAPPGRQNRYRRAVGAIRRGSGRGRGRTQSESPSAELRMQAPSFTSPRGSPEPASEPTSRGASGGIVVDNGCDLALIPFGDTTAEDLDVASHRLRQQRIERPQPPGIPTRRSSVSSSRGSYHSQLSPPTMSRGDSSGSVRKEAKRV